VAPTVGGIRADHVARYRWAVSALKPGSFVIDVGCGIGYGASILAAAGMRVLAIDVDAETIAYAKAHYGHENITFVTGDALRIDLPPAAAATCFEMIEHVADPLPMLRKLRDVAGALLASVPNEEVFPFKGYAFHHRHYTKVQFNRLLADAGWQTIVWAGQEGPHSPVEVGVNGRTLVAISIHDEAERAPEPAQIAAPVNSAPKHVSIVGLGPSSAQYVSIARGLGGRHKYCDETWVINAYGDVLAHDRVFHMDDVRIQQIRADAEPDSNIAAMLQWLRQHPGPVVTSRAHPDFPGLVEFPLEAVVNQFDHAYFNNTAAYAVAYALHIGVKKLSLFGMDFTYPNAHDAEKGRACVEYWVGQAVARGVKIVIPKTSTLLDALNDQAERFYGYDTVDLKFRREAGRIVVEKAERTQLPTAEDIEERYCHARHPNALVEAEALQAREVAASRRAPEVK
jgi:hypothetical protein